MWLVYTIVAIVSRAVYGVLTKVLSNHVKVGAMTQTLFLLVASTVWVLVASPFVGGLDFSRVGEVWLPLIIAIVTSALGNVLYFKGILTLESATTQIAFSSILIWSLVMAIAFLGTSLSAWQFLGVVLLLLAILLAQYQKKALKLQPGIVLIVLSAACFAGFQISSAAMSHSLSTGTYAFLTYFGDVVLIGVWYAKQIVRDVRQARGHLSALTKTAFITGAASVLYNMFAYIAYHAAPDAGIVVLLLTSQVVLAVILSVVFLKERANVAYKIAAGVLALVAALLIKA